MNRVFGLLVAGFAAGLCFVAPTSAHAVTIYSMTSAADACDWGYNTQTSAVDVFRITSYGEVESRDAAATGSRATSHAGSIRTGT